MSDSLRPHGLQQARLPCPLPSPGVCSNSCPLSRWCHPIISSSVVPFSSCLQSFQASRSFPMNWPFASGGQSIGASTSVSVLPMNVQNWFPLGLTGLISLQLLAESVNKGCGVHQSINHCSQQPPTPPPPQHPPTVYPEGIQDGKKQDTCLLESFNGPEPYGTESTIRKWKRERSWYPLVYAEDQ